MYRRDDKEYFMLLTYPQKVFFYKFLLLVSLEGAFIYPKCKTYYYSRVVQFLFFLSFGYALLYMCTFLFILLDKE